MKTDLLAFEFSRIGCCSKWFKYLCFQFVNLLRTKFLCTVWQCFDLFYLRLFNEWISTTTNDEVKLQKQDVYFYALCSFSNELIDYLTNYIHESID